MPGRTFVVTVSESPPRILVEEVRSGRRVATEDLGAVGTEIAALLEEPRPAEAPRERSVSAET